MCNYRMFSVACIGAIALACLITPGSAAAQGLPTCDSTEVGSLADRPFAKTNPCTVPRQHAIVEAGYFQNASTVGGTQLAAYPLGHVRYGLTKRLEVFVDPASAFAKNGENGQGIYGWTQSGGGAKWQFAQNRHAAFAITVDARPQTDETAPISTVSKFSSSVSSRVSLHSKSSLGAVIGVLNYGTLKIPHTNTAAIFERLVYARDISRKTRALVVLASQSNVAKASHAQMRGGMAVQRNVNERLSLDADIGTAFNATGSTKAHYLGGGLTLKL